MKFGQNLEQYSVPQWAPYNLDYDNVKKLIKKATSDGAVKAIRIPGQDSEDDLVEGFEQDLYLAMSEELDRIELYCKMKFGEIQRRLEHHSKLLARLNTKSTRASVKRLQRLSKVEEGVLRAGQDLQLLSRFIGANRLAFVKLLKKYKKWGGSVRVIQKFRRERLDRSNFLAHSGDPLSSLLSQYTSLLETVRAPFDIKDKSVESPFNNSNTVAHDLQRTFLHGTQADFDAAFSWSKPSNNGGRATYWIHQDNLLQVHILMQAVSNQRRQSAADTPVSQAKATTSPLNTFGSEWSGCGMIVCGSLESFKSSPPKNNPTAGIFYTTSDKGVTLQLPKERFGLRRKEVAILLQTEYELPHDNDAVAFNSARSWLHKHKEVESLVELGYSRTRFAGFSNTDNLGIWATLDNDIIISNLKTNTSDKDFPHAILNIRWEGQTMPDVVRNLDRNVIAERIPNFDMTVHAIALAYPGIAEPEWMDILKNDLRRTSVAEPPSLHLDTNTKNSSATSTSDRPPLSPFSTAQDHSSATSMHETSELIESIRRKRREQIKRKPQLSTPHEEELQPRYWNEFDDGDEEMRQPEPYSVDVYPDDEDILVSIFSAIGRKFKSAARRIRMRTDKPEHRPLLSTSSSSANTSSEDVSIPQTRPRAYSTFASHSIVQPGESPSTERAVLIREKMLLYATILTYMLAVTAWVMALVVETIGRKRYITESRVFSVVGILMSFLLAALGLGCGYLRERRTSLLGRGILLMGFLVVCVADAVLMIAILQGFK